jgi:plasmid stability protein
MAVGLRPGTHPTSLVLPEVVGPATRHGRSGGARANDALGPAIAAAEQQAHATRGAARQGVSLKITLPPSLPSPTHVSEDAEIYCSCRRPSFGEVDFLEKPHFASGRLMVCLCCR